MLTRSGEFGGCGWRKEEAGERRRKQREITRIEVQREEEISELIMIMKEFHVTMKSVPVMSIASQN